MGEQRPMGTIRTFVDAIARRQEPPIKSWSKPLDDPALFDIRRIVMEGDRVPPGGTTQPLRPVVDFYEFYWSHLMQRNNLGQLLRWLRVLVFRAPSQVPAHLSRIYWTGWVVLAVLAALVIAVAISLWVAGTLFSVWPWVWGAITFAYGLASYWLLRTLGDAARYLDTLPDNVAARFAIQDAGVRMIEKLHAEERYNRIVVVGHSLGAMIGYDVLRHAWLPFAKRFDPVEPHKVKQINALRDAVEHWPEGFAPADFRALQTAAWAEHIGNGGHWRVTDFITLGSPLAHAEVLMADDPADFRRRKEGRELSTCPPTWDEAFGITRDIPVEPIGEQKKPVVRTPDHAGVFAFTHWTNFHCPSKWVVDGDFLSGPAAPMFGLGIEDRAVRANHTNYWMQGPASETLAQLVAAMDLTGRVALPNQAGPGEES
jgi:hypothetical protein